MGTFTFHFGPGQGARIGVFQRLSMTLFFGLFLGMGLLFFWLLAKSAVLNFRTYAWTRTPCRILASASEKGRDTDEPYAFWVEYKYEAGGREFVSHRYTLSYAGSSEYSEVQELLERYRPDDNRTCLVDPADPSRSVLERESPWGALALFFPLIFVAVGAGGLWFAWRGLLRKEDASQTTVPALSRGRSWNGGPLGAAAFFSVFLLAGLGMLYPMGIQPVSKIVSARGWAKTPCTIVSGDVKSHDSNDGTTYSIYFLYEYTFEGHTYRSDRYEFVKYSSSGYEGKAAVVNQHPPGSRCACYVNPIDPAEAVMRRDAGGSLLFALFPLVFVAVGGGGVFFSLRSWRRQARPPRADALAEPLPVALSQSPKALRAAASPLGKFLGMLAIAAFWNGIVSIFVWQAAQGWTKGHPDILLTLFLSVFVLAGLALVWGVLYYFLALFDPRVHLILSEESVRLGDTLELQWALSGGLRKVLRLRIALEGREEATYSSGKSSSTDKEVFLSRDLVDTAATGFQTSGAASLAVPADSMHSFKSLHNRVVWAVQIKGEIPEWPDLDEEFVLQVLPAEGRGGSGA